MAHLTEQSPEPMHEESAMTPSTARPGAGGRRAGSHRRRSASTTCWPRLEGLEDVPVDEHVAVFEHAHERLRRALDDAGDRPTPA